MVVEILLRTPWVFSFTLDSSAGVDVYHLGHAPASLVGIDPQPCEREKNFP